MSEARPCCSEIASLCRSSWRRAQSATFSVLSGKRKIRINTAVTAYAHDFFLFTGYQNYWHGLFRQNWEQLDFLIILLLPAPSAYCFLLAWSLLEAIHLSVIKNVDICSPVPTLTLIVISWKLFSCLLSLVKVIPVIPWAY